MNISDDTTTATRRPGQRGGRISDELAAEMYAYYHTGKTTVEVGKKFGGRNSGTIRSIFKLRGFKMRPLPAHIDPVTGYFKRYVPATKAEISAEIAKATKMRIPARLLTDWRDWSIERRGAFISRLRAKLQLRDQRPELPFSINVTPFDYTTPAAWEIVNRMNEGTDSRSKRTQLRSISQGVIYEGKLYFWAGSKTGYVEGCRHPRRVLHHVIFEHATGHRVKPPEVLRFRDGNQNNLDPSNLYLATRNDLARENQSAHYRRKSRAIVSRLLERTQTKPDPNEPENTDTLTTLRRSAA